MPIYEYRCEECDHVFEVLQSGFDERQETCPVCKGASKRIISNTSFVLKGSGWYVTDYAGKNPSNGAPAPSANGDGDGNGKAADKASSGASDAATPAAKTESAAPAKPACACAGKSACAES